MCGIVGLISAARLQTEALLAMNAKLAHRGPDDHGIWIDNDSGVALAHRRLSIIDVSAAGHQPMVSASGRYVLTFNGEIYNFGDLREQLVRAGQAPTWKGQSDTEVLLASIDAWGIDRAITRAEGMFALAIWDSHSRAITLVRDRMGEKPLYFGWIGNDFVFASELKALAAHPGWAPRINRRAVQTLLQLGYCTTAETVVEGAFRLPPGTLLTLPLALTKKAATSTQLEPLTRRYWALPDVAAQGTRTKWTGSRSEAADELEQLLSRAVGRQLVADVPVGAFLSGGTDSSLVVALMQRHTSGRVRTFCIGFDDPAHDEAKHASAVATHLQTDHTELYVSGRQALDLIPALPSLSDEPLADTSQIPTLLLCRLARQHVKVALTGDGGDELFAGYTRYVAMLRSWGYLSRLPAPLRKTVSATLASVAASHLVLAGLPKFLGGPLLRISARQQGRNLSTLRIAQMSGIGTNLLLGRTANDLEGQELESSPSLSPLRKLLLADQEDYLPNDILTKVDRAAMSVGLETRVPMLDPAVVTFSWRLSDEILVERQLGKSLLREIAYRHVPRNLLDRPKQGFAPPISLWLRSALRPWAESLLSELPPSLEDVVDGKKVRALWRQHQAGVDLGYVFWRLLMYSAWAREYRVEG